MPETDKNIPIFPVSMYYSCAKQNVNLLPTQTPQFFAKIMEVKVIKTVSV